MNGTCAFTGENPHCQVATAAGECIQCYYPTVYYLDSNNICSPKQPNCKTFNIQNGDCTECNFDYTLWSGMCVDNTVVMLTVAATQAQGNMAWDGDGI